LLEKNLNRADVNYVTFQNFGPYEVFLMIKLNVQFEFNWPVSTYKTFGHNRLKKLVKRYLSLTRAGLTMK